MSVFMISPKVSTTAPVKADAKEVPATTVEAGSEEVSAGEQKEASAVAVKTSMSEKPVMVKIDGPIGRLFTDTLNKILANESYMTMFSKMPVEMHERDDSGDSDEEPDVQVYCWKAEALNAQDLVQVTNLITKTSSSNVIIAIEASSGRLSDAVKLLPAFEKMDRVKVCYSQQAAAEALVARLS